MYFYLSKGGGGLTVPIIPKKGESSEKNRTRENESEMLNKTFEIVFMLNCDCTQKVHYYHVHVKREEVHGEMESNEIYLSLCAVLVNGLFFSVNPTFKLKSRATRTKVKMIPTIIFSTCTRLRNKRGGPNKIKNYNSLPVAIVLSF